MNRPIKILIHGMTKNLGGLESFIMNYYRNINHEKVHFDFLCVNNKPAYYREIIDRGGRVYTIPGRKRYVAHILKLNSIFRENKYDVFWSNRCDLSGIVLPFKIACKHRVPLRILHAHNTGTTNETIPFLYLFSHEINKHRIGKNATDFWACSEKAGDYFYTKKIIDSSKYRVINNAIDAADFKFDNTARNDTRKILNLENKFIIGHVGRFNFQKNHEFLIRVFYEIYKKRPNSVLLLIGDGELRSKIENMVKILNLTNVVYFLGVRTDIPSLVNAMDMLVFPSKFEGLGITLIEAQAVSLYSFASTNVPTEAAITDLVSFVDLNKPPEEWAELILAKRDYSRVDMTEEIRKAGYDIKTEAAKVEQYLLNRLEDMGVN